MFCPKCQSEYRAGFSECSECHVPLVSALPVPARQPAAPDMRLVTVFEGTDPAICAVASSILDSAKIPFTIIGEGLQDLFAWGRMPAKVNIFVGPIKFQVEEKDATDAATILKDMIGSEGL